MNSRFIQTIVAAAALLTMGRDSLLGQASVTLGNFTQTPDTNVVENGRPVAVAITATPAGDAVIANVNLIYRTLAPGILNEWNSNTMTAIGGGVYSGLVARLPAGEVQYYVECHFSGTDAVSPVSSVVSNYTVSAFLNDYRFDTIEDGTPAPSYWAMVSGTISNEWNRQILGSADSTRWYASSARVFFYGDSLQLDGCSAPYLYLRDVQGAYWRSPYLAEGVGRIDFVSRMRYVDLGATIAAQITTNEAPTEWQTVQTINYLLGGLPISGPIILNDRKVRYVRFLRTDATGGDSPFFSFGAIAFDRRFRVCGGISYWLGRDWDAATGWRSGIVTA